MPGKVETAAGATAPTAALMDTVETAAGATAPVAASTNELRGTTAELFVANRRPTVETAVPIGKLLPSRLFCRGTREQASLS